VERVRARIIVTTIPTTPITSISGLIVFKPSLSVIPLIRVMIQKALSLSQLTGFEPQPIAMREVDRVKPKLISGRAMPENAPAVVIMATVAEPEELRIAAVSRKATGRIAASRLEAARSSHRYASAAEPSQTPRRPR
jgi:hypothetical protein